MLNILKSEFYKTNKSFLPIIYIFLPLCYAILMYLAYLTTSLNGFSLKQIVRLYIVILSSALPLVISLITSKVVEMEKEAGHFHLILSECNSRLKAYLAKFIFLILNTQFSLFLATFIFAILFRRQNIYDWTIETLLIFVGCLPLHLIHLWINFKFGKGASIVLSFLQTLLSIILLTNLGDKIWYYFPSTWSTRLSITYLTLKGENIRNTVFNAELIKWSLYGIPLIVFILAFSLLWFCFWEPIANNE